MSICPFAMSALLKTIAANVRRYRAEKGWTQTRLARAIRCRQSTVSGIESASTRPGLALLEEIAAALGIAPGQLVVEGMPHREFVRLPRDVQRLVRLSASRNPHLVRLAEDLTQLIGRHITLAERGQPRRRRPARR